MFVLLDRTLHTISLNLLLQFAQGRFGFDANVQQSDLETALLGVPTNELQEQILDWYNSAKANVDSLIFGYVAKLQLSADDVAKSPIPAIAVDLMRYELCNNDADEGYLKRRDFAMRQLEKIEKGTIQVKAPSPSFSPGMKTAKPTSHFNWDGY